MGRPRTYRTRFERLVANTVLAVADNPQSCWVWTGHIQHNGYPRFCERNSDGQPRNRQAHRAMLEEVLDLEFPFDEAGHLCRNPGCVNPDHLEVQTRTMNHCDRINSPIRAGDGCLIPTLFPRPDPLQDAANAAWEGEGTSAAAPPF